ncbi:MAG: 5'-nucleotidase C-terminal domain-containing protein [Chloroflexi bacterium]|nr:5'-nucleotidase C-terminal domain-containing protein [Chloroflexota bacterium]
MSSSTKRILVTSLIFATLAVFFVLALTAHGEASLQKQVTILHTNDFHGYLETDYRGRGGSAYMAGKINEIRTEVGAANVALLDAGDIYLGAAPISQLLLGESAIDIYNMIGYDVAAYGNHEFDKGQDVLMQRTAQSTFPWVSANIVLEGTEWDHPTWTQPYVILTLGEPGNEVRLGVIGLTTDETPLVTLKGTTEGLVFKDLTETVLHYYDEVKAQSDALIVLAHMGTEDSGPYKGLKTVAQELIDAGKPVDLMIGGHQHQALSTPTMVGNTAIVCAGYYGRWLGRVNATVDPATKKLTVDSYELITINNTLTPDPAVADRVAYWASVVAPVLQQPVGYTNVSLVRNYNGESNIGDLVADSMRWKADQYDDGEVNGSVDIAFTNPGGLRADIVIPEGATLPYTITWGDTFNVLPFANTLYLMDLTGWQIQALLDQAATLYKGILQSSGVTWYWYNNCSCASPTAWGAYGVMVNGEPLDYKKTYRVVTNNFLAPGGDGWVTFIEGTNRWDTYYDMQEGLNEYIHWYNENVGPIDYQVEDRIVQLDKVVTILHTNDEHGRAYTDTYRGNPIGLPYIASLVKHERAKNPNALLMSASDTIQGNAFAFYFRNAPGPTPGGETTLANPMMAAMNLMGYDVSTIGNHEYNFGRETFAKALGQANFPFVAANVSDDGRYGFIEDNVQDYVTFDVEGLKVAVYGLTNPRVPSYELPSNIEGLTFVGGFETSQTLVPQILADENPDLMVALTHLGYAPYEGSRPEDTDVFIAENMAGIDVIIGGHSHTKLDPAVLVTSDINPEGTLIAQAERHAYYLGKVTVGFKETGHSYEIVLREGRLLPAGLLPPDPELEALMEPYVAELNAYTSTVIGESLVDLDARTAFYEETAAANLQADASKWVLEQAGIPVDFHLSGAMTNQYVPAGTLTVGNMFTLMPYENSLVVMRMNGPQLKRVLERSFYNYDLWRQGRARYTTCFLDISSGGQINYDPETPESGDNVVWLRVNGVPVDFNDADTYYNVSTVNYLAAGACSYSDEGVSIWPLDQIIYDTQYYVRDAVIDYIKAHTPISPQVEGRILFAGPPCNASPTVHTYSGPVGAFFDQSDMTKVYFGARFERPSTTGAPCGLCTDFVELYVGGTEVPMIGEPKHEFSKKWAGPPGYDFWTYVFGPYTVDTVGKPLAITLVSNGVPVWSGNLRPNAVLNLNELYVFSGLYQDTGNNPSPGRMRLYAYRPWQEGDPEVETAGWVSGKDYDIWQEVSANVAIPSTGYWALSYRNELADLVDQIKLGYMVWFTPPCPEASNIGPSVLNRFGIPSPNNPNGIEFHYVWPALYGGNIMQHSGCGE